MKTDPSILPQYRGAPVPWITRWSGEVSRAPWTVVQDQQGPKIIYPPDGLPEKLDAHGVLWQREGLTRGGKPEWSAVNTYRQRRSMQRRLCQVCGQKITDRPIRWLMGIDQLDEIDDDWLTVSAPTCEGCIDLSLELCPNLPRYGYMILKVLDYSVWGVYGDILTRVGMAGSRPEPRAPGLRRFLGSVGYEEDYGQLFTLRMVLAKQQIVKLGKHVLEEYVEGQERPAFFDGPTTNMTDLISGLQDR